MRPSVPEIRLSSDHTDRDDPLKATSAPPVGCTPAGVDEYSQRKLDGYRKTMNSNARHFRIFSRHSFRTYVTGNHVVTNW